MLNAMWLFSYKLKKGKSVEDFLKISEKLKNEHISKAKGFISWKQLFDGKKWADLGTWETMEDLKNFEKGTPPPIAKEFYSFINFLSLKSQYFTIEKSY